MESKNRVSSVVVLVMITVLVATCFVPTAFARCKNGDQVSLNGDQVSFDGEVDETKFVSRLLLRDGGGLRRNDGCSGSSCNILNDPCCGGCSCIPVGILVGVCAGSCC